VSTQATLQAPAALKPPATRLIRLIGLTLALGYLIVLAGAYQRRISDRPAGPADRQRLRQCDGCRTAHARERTGRAYDWPLHKQAEVRAIGHDFEDYYGWHYPPTSLFVAAALATLPYLTAAIGWLAATICAYAAAIAGILGRRTGVLVALGFPAALWNITAGQNGFLTAALIGCTLSLLQSGRLWPASVSGSSPTSRNSACCFRWC
jgi:arabinofuranan 3-O-arabinosyltransferase